MTNVHDDHVFLDVVRPDGHHEELPYDEADEEPRIDSYWDERDAL